MEKTDTVCAMLGSTINTNKWYKMVVKTARVRFRERDGLRGVILARSIRYLEVDLLSTLVDPRAVADRRAADFAPFRWNRGTRRLDLSVPHGSSTTFENFFVLLLPVGKLSEFLTSMLVGGWLDGGHSDLFAPLVRRLRLAMRCNLGWVGGISQELARFWDL